MSNQVIVIETVNRKAPDDQLKPSKWTRIKDRVTNAFSRKKKQDRDDLQNEKETNIPEMIEKKPKLTIKRRFIQFFAKCLPSNRKIEEDDLEKSTPGDHTRLKNKYKRGKLLGEGSFAKVYQAVQRKTQRPVVIKRILKSRIDELMLGLDSEGKSKPTEVIVLEQVKDTRGLVNMIEYIESRRYFSIVMEPFGDGTTLEKYIEKREESLPVPVAARIIRDVTEAAQQLHQKIEFIHADIKLDNVLFDEASLSALLIDVGLSFKFHSGPAGYGSQLFSAPEVFVEYPGCGPHLDVWALGIMLYYMLTKRYPFTSAYEVMAGEVDLTFTNCEDLKYLLNGMLHREKDERFSTEQILSSDWILKNVV